MVQLKTEILDNNLIRHYAEDENGNRYMIKQLPTNEEYEDAIDLITNPNHYSYIVTDEKIEIETILDEIQEEPEISYNIKEETVADITTESASVSADTTATTMQNETQTDKSSGSAMPKSLLELLQSKSV